jgi:VWFA-related protein
MGMRACFLPLSVALLLSVSVHGTKGLVDSEPLMHKAAGPPGSEQNTASQQSGTDRQISIDVQVTDKSGGPVRGLHRDDFTLLDNDQPQDVVSFLDVNGDIAKSDKAAPADPPAEIVLVIDAANAPLQSVNFERKEVQRFLLQNGGKLPQPTALVVFSDTGTRVQKGFSQDGNVLAAQFDQYETGLRSTNKAQGNYGATELYALSLKVLSSLADYEGKRPGRKLMIWISPGWPLQLIRTARLTDKDEQLLFDSIVATSATLRQARITLYSIDPLRLADQRVTDFTYYKNFLKGVTDPSHALPGNLGLQVLAEQSGGRAFSSSNDLVRAISDCIADADAYYVLSFESRPADRADEYHTLRVMVKKPGVTARTCTGYYNER